MEREAETGIRCPRCGQFGSRADECERCGVVFAKVRAEADPRPRRAVSGPPPLPPVSPSPGGGRRLALLAGALALAFAVLALANVARDRQARADLELASMAPVAPPPPAPLAASTATTADAPEGPRPTQPAPAPRSATSAGAAEPSPSTVSPAAADRAQPSASVSHRWYEGSDGFIAGMEEASAEGKPVLVYFYTDWCPYCRRLDRDLLSRAAVAATTKHFVKIKVNPEHGPAERLLAHRYGISGYPSLYVHEAGAPRPTKIRTTTQGRLKRPSEFTASLTRAAGESFASG